MMFEVRDMSIYMTLIIGHQVRILENSCMIQNHGDWYITP